MNRKGKPSMEPFRLLSVDQVLELERMRWSVRNVFPLTGLAAIFGPSGTGKSFLSLDLCAKVASGVPWFGNPVAADLLAVLFVLEGKAGLRQRVEAWQLVNGREVPEGVRFMCDPFALNDEARVARAVKELDTGGGANLIVIDTLNRASVGVDENRSADMGALIAGASRLQVETESCVVLVHHTGKDEGRGLRGHSSLHAALDTIVEVHRNGDGERWWQLVKSKDGEDGTSRKFELEVVEVGTDEFDLTVTSAAIRETDNDGPRREKKATLGSNQSAVLGALRHLIVTTEVLEEAEPDSVGATWEEAVTHCKGHIDVADGSRRTERTKDALKSLVKAGHVAERDGKLYLPK